MAENDAKQKKIIIGIIAVLVVIAAIYLVGNSNGGSNAVSSDGSAEFKRGVELAKEHKFKEALEQYVKAAEKENMQAAYTAGWYLTQGRKGVEKDITKGMAYLKKAADAGRSDAAYVLGKAYMDPLKGVKKDYKEGIKYIKMAAEKGHGTAMYVLGIYYDIGRGVKKDKDKAIEWLEKAAKKSGVKTVRDKAAARANKIRSAQ
ncbi:MAG: sel1 repeat family protein [Synergistes sp.]|nr:sel1 repeat family protein [Synergistes sp.]